MSILASVAGEAPAQYTRAWYRSSIQTFLEAKPESVLGLIAANTGFAILLEQRNAWLDQAAVLKDQLEDLSGEIFFEFSIPRMGRRIDVVLIIGAIVFVIEFKVGDSTFDRAGIEQVWDYALDLKNFHAASHTLPIVPILVATESTKNASRSVQDSDGTFQPLLVGGKGLRNAIEKVLESTQGPQVAVDVWAHSAYRPTPTIVEAARALYAQHSVEAIARYDAGAKNLALTSTRVEALVEQAKSRSQKIICFVTGVPGAGKTLVGLNVATRRHEFDASSHAVFLSGNGPLVAVLREALTRDEVARTKAEGQKATKKGVGGKVKAFIQNVHHFRDDSLVDPGAPSEHVVVFDEAQRAWNLKQTAAFMQRKKNRPGFDQSEPQFLISCLDRHQDWCVVVCLVGGGQEINTGEAGIGAWLEAMRDHFPNWHVYISDRLTDAEYAAAGALSGLKLHSHVSYEADLHLAVSMRSFRAEHVSAFVKAVLDCEIEGARNQFAKISANYPIRITRDLAKAKEWIRKSARGSERYGLVASSKAQRLKPHAVDVRVNVDPVNYFLNDKDDTRSSYYLEDAATEFQVQGLELDWACVTWDADFRFVAGEWSFHDFRGSGWTNVKNADNRSFLKNAYRVLLTRARQGMVIFVPPGDPADATRLPSMYDSTFQYLADLGIPKM